MFRILQALIVGVEIMTFGTVASISADSAAHTATSGTPHSAAPVIQATQATQSPPTVATTILPSQLQAAASGIQSRLSAAGFDVEVHVDSTTDQQVLTVRDSATGSVIRQIPGDQALWLAEHLDTAASALLKESV